MTTIRTILADWLKRASDWLRPTGGGGPATPEK